MKECQKCNKENIDEDSSKRLCEACRKENIKEQYRKNQEKMKANRVSKPRKEYSKNNSGPMNPYFLKRGTISISGQKGI